MKITAAAKLLADKRIWQLILGLCLLLLALMVLLGSAVVQLPLVGDHHLPQYSQAAGELPAEIPWQQLVAVDAVRFHQDFSRVTEASIRETAWLFVACDDAAKNVGLDWVLDRVGESFRMPVTLEVPGEITWEAKMITGQLQVELQDGLDRPVSGELEPGRYTLLVYATEAPARFRLDVWVKPTEPVCHDRSMDEVMTDLGFSEFDRELAKSLVEAWTDFSVVPAPPTEGGLYVWPVSGEITSRFGYRIHPIFGTWVFHAGVDIATQTGKPVKAAAAGTVVAAGRDGGYGNVVRVDHGGFTTVYAHLHEVTVQVGQQVGRGQVVGTVGNTGNSTGPHLHFEWWLAGQPVDPLTMFR